MTVVGDEHGNQHTATAHVVVETDTPTAQPPSTSVRTGAAIGSTSVPTSTGWGAATDATSAIGAYELQRSVDGGAWTTVATTSAGIRSAAGTQTLNHAYRYRVRARDAVGNWGSYASGATLTSALLAGAGVRGQLQRDLAQVHLLGRLRGHHDVRDERGRPRPHDVQRPRHRGRRTHELDPGQRGRLRRRRLQGHDQLPGLVADEPGCPVLHASSRRSARTRSSCGRSGNGRVDLDAFVILR